MLFKQQQQQHHEWLACMGPLTGCARDPSPAQCSTCSDLHATCRQASVKPRLPVPSCWQGSGKALEVSIAKPLRVVASLYTLRTHKTVN